MGTVLGTSQLCPEFLSLDFQMEIRPVQKQIKASVEDQYQRMLLWPRVKTYIQFLNVL